jgi:hypothetical protein
MSRAVHGLAVTGLAVTVLLSGCGSRQAGSDQPVAQSLSLVSPAPSVPTPGGSTTPTPAATTPTPSTAPTPTASAKAPARPHFDTPEAAMRSMAAAFNRHDLTALRWVTTPESRQELFDMWPQQVHLRLSSCEREIDGTYTCSFPHDPPKGMKVPPGGVVATMVVAPADLPGWYLGGIVTCG